MILNSERSRYRIQRVLRNCRLPGTKGAGPLIGKHGPPYREDTAYLLRGGNVCWKSFKRENSLTVSWWTSPRASQSTEEGGFWSGGDMSSPAEPQSAFPPYWAMGVRIAGVPT